MDHGELNSVNYSDREDVRKKGPFRSINKFEFSKAERMGKIFEMKSEIFLVFPH